MSGALSPEMYAVLLQAYEMAKAQIESIKDGSAPMNLDRLAVLEKMLTDLGRLVHPKEMLLN